MILSQVLPAITKEPPKMSESVGGSSILSSASGMGMGGPGDIKLDTFRRIAAGVGDLPRGSQVKQH